nr:FtsQ-type POTRA domain-containing protein [Agromyces seonyuensis]
MALREIRIEGASAVPAAAVHDALADELGTPLPLIDDRAVHAALSSFSLIERYSTELVPPGTLIVRLTERTPIGVIEGNGGWDLVDAAGVVISHSDAPAEGQPVLEVPDGIASEEFVSVGDVIRSLPDQVRAQVRGVTAETPSDVRLSLDGGASVVWGDDTEAALKASVLAALVRQAPPGFAGQYDVSAPMSPVMH